MNEIALYRISEKYIKFLRADRNLKKNVFDNSEVVQSNHQSLGLVIPLNHFQYYIPFSSPKDSDYITQPDGTKEIRRSTVPIVRMTASDTVSGQIELLGTLKLNNMIPVPKSELTPYYIANEKDLDYKTIVMKEYAFLKSNYHKILKNAYVLYRQKNNHLTYNKRNTRKVPSYIYSTVNFLYAESKYHHYLLSADVPNDFTLTGLQEVEAIIKGNILDQTLTVDELWNILFPDGNEL